MRFMIIVKATKDTEAGVMPEASMLTAMANYHEALVKAGVLLDANGLQPTSKGWRIRYQGRQLRVIDGPFSDFVGQVDEINLERGKVRVMVSIFGRATPVELDFMQVQAI